MELQVRVVGNGPGPRPPAGTPVRIEVRDVTEQDVASIVVVATDARVDDADEADDNAFATAVLEVADAALTPQRDLTVWARVATSGADRVAVGDWITMQSVPVRATGPRPGVHSTSRSDPSASCDDRALPTSRRRRR